MAAIRRAHPGLIAEMALHRDLLATFLREEAGWNPSHHP
jgi:hypothetical protein